MRTIVVVAAIGFVAIVAVFGAGCTTTKIIVATPTPAGPDAAAISSPVSSTQEADYIRDATMRIQQEQGSKPEPSDPEWQKNAVFYAIGYTAMAEFWRSLDPPESYRTKHAAVQRALDKLDAAGETWRSGNVSKAAVDFVVAQSLFDSAAEEWLKP